MPNRLRQPTLWQSLRFRVGAGAVVLVSVIFALVTLNTLNVLQQVAQESSRSSIRQVAQMLNLALAPQTDTAESLAHITPYLQELISPDSDGLVYLVLQDERGQMLAQTDAVPSPLPPVDADVDQAWSRGVLHLQQSILLGNQQVGLLRYGLSSSLLRDAASRLFRQNLTTYAVVMVSLLALLTWALTGLGQRLRTLAEAGARLARGSYDVTVPTVGNDELTLLGHELNTMAEAVRVRIRALEESQASVRRLNEELELRVTDRTTELVQANQSLESTLADLRQLQEGLVQSEKLASLGALVAAVAHELNTPIGNALTVASGFGQKAQAFEQQARVRLQRQALEQFLADSAEASLLLQSNLFKASELITSFKHVAIDQTSSKRRSFDLERTIGDVLATLSPSIKHRLVRVETALAAGVRMRSYPGPLGQVLTNLYNNALMHGFPVDHEGAVGVIRVTSRRLEPARVVIEVADNGLGMTPDILKRVFDPFFTTRLGQGGSGLGMHIVHNIVVGLLQGQIEIDSQAGVGTCVRLTLPLEATGAPIDTSAMALEDDVALVALATAAPVHPAGREPSP